jgi:hypothetical protein
MFTTMNAPVLDKLCLQHIIISIGVLRGYHDNRREKSVSKENLKTLRIIVPGVMLLLCILPAFLHDFTLQSLNDPLKLVEGLCYLIAVLPLGAIYYSLRLRDLSFRRPVSLIDRNIQDRMLSQCSSDPEVMAAQNNLRKGKTLLDIFYNFIDNDNSLMDRANDVRLNGLILSSISDLIVISALASCSYFVAALITGAREYWYVAITLLLILILARVLLMPLTLHKHLSLSDDQLNFIFSQYPKQLHDKLVQASKTVGPDASTNPEKSN